MSMAPCTRTNQKYWVLLALEWPNAGRTFARRVYAKRIQFPLAACSKYISILILIRTATRVARTMRSVILGMVFFGCCIVCWCLCVCMSLRIYPNERVHTTGLSWAEASAVCLRVRLPIECCEQCVRCAFFLYCIISNWIMYTASLGDRWACGALAERVPSFRWRGTGGDRCFHSPGRIVCDEPFGYDFVSGINIYILQKRLELMLIHHDAWSVF